MGIDRRSDGLPRPFVFGSSAYVNEYDYNYDSSYRDQINRILSACADSSACADDEPTEPYVVIFDFASERTFDSRIDNDNREKAPDNCDYCAAGVLHHHFQHLTDNYWPGCDDYNDPAYD